MAHTYILHQDTPLSKCRSAIHNAVQLPAWSRPFLVTLTFKQGRQVEPGVWEYLDREKMRCEVGSLLNRLNKQIYGNAAKRYNRKAYSLAVAEENSSQRKHYHILLDCPRLEMRESYPSMICQLWQSTARWADKEMKVEERDTPGLWYVTKYPTKPNYLDAYDWHNTHFPHNNGIRVVDR